MQINMIYEDNHLLIIEKPVNVPVQQDQSNDLDLLSLLKQDLKTRFKKPGNVFLGLVHRLDRPVGGVMVFAKTSKAASRLSDQIRRNQMTKVYFAVVHGVPDNKNTRLEHYLIKNTKTNTVSVVSSEHKGAKKAVLEYSCLASSDSLSLIKVHLHTGRPHQIRVQLAAAGFPLWGDQKYGAALNTTGQQLALWSAKLGFEHPVQKQPVIFTAEPPNRFPWTLWPESAYLTKRSEENAKH